MQGMEEELNELCQIGKSVILEQLGGGMYSCLSLVQCDSSDRV